MDEIEHVEKHADSPLPNSNCQVSGDASRTRAQLTRWKKYGHDRLYVRDSDGVRVGWVDLHTSTTHREDGAPWPPEADALVAQWCGDHGVALPTASQPPPAPLTIAHANPPQPAAAVAPERTSTPPSPSTDVGDTDERDAAVPPSGHARRPWKDLSKNRAGAALKAAAKEHKTWWTSFLSIFGIETPSARWDAGYKGERRAARTMWLMRLFGWRALYSVPFGSRGSDIDHVLIGPGGVVTVNTKYHRGARVTAGHTRVLVNGHAERYAQKSQYEADQATRLLSTASGHPVDVQAIILIVGARSVRCGQTAGIDVLTRLELPIWLRSHGGRLDRQQRRELFETARRSSTWQGL